MTNGTTAYETILVEHIGKIVRITLNRPERRNAISPQLHRELLDATKIAENSKDVRAIIIRGAGSSFCSGYDLLAYSTYESRAQTRLTPEEDIARMRELGKSWEVLWNARVPVIAQVQGYCVAGGTDLALHCDLIIAAHDAQIGFPPARAQGGPGTHMWLYNAGPQWSKRLLLTGDLVSGAKAAEIGLVLESVSSESLDEHVLTLATRMTNIDKDMLAHSKRIVNLGVEIMGRSQLQMMAVIHDVLGHLAPGAADFNEVLHTQGVQAALDHRDGPFR